MNAFLAAAKLPWTASTKTTRWLILGVMPVLLVVAPPLAVLYRGPHWISVCSAVWSIAVGAVWLLVIPNALWIGRDARALHLPSIPRISVTTPWVYALLSVVLPAAAFGMLGGHTLQLMLLFTLVASGCLCYLLLPSWSGTALLLIVIVAQGVHDSHLSDQASHYFPAWSIPLAAASTLCAAWRWRVLLRADVIEYAAMGKPLAWQFHLVREKGYFAAMAHAGDHRRNIRDGWFRLRLNLSSVDPQHAPRAIRVALGSAFAPQMLSARMLQGAWITSGLMLALWLGAGGDFSGRIVAAMTAPRNVMTLGLVCTFVLFVAFAVPIRTRWSGHQQELALLALLPGLGSAATAKRAVARASLSGPVAYAGVLLALLCGFMAIARGPWIVVLLLVLEVGALLALCSSLVLGWIGNRPVPTATWLPGGTAVLIMASLSVGLVSTAHYDTHSAWVVLVSVWAALLIAFGVLVLRGWRALQRRPHPFLPSGAQ